MYLHSSKYDQSCPLSTIVPTNTIVPPSYV